MRDNTQFLVKFCLSPLLLLFLPLLGGLRKVGRPENNSTSVSCSKWPRSWACTRVLLSQLPQYKHTNYQTSAGLHCNGKVSSVGHGER